jgi:8-oxo-dGTP pyrophosphatase MutT (NUDIX family)
MEQTIPSTPRRAATLLVVRDDPFEVLMMRRSAGATFPSMLVFPGGVVEPSDASDEWMPRLSGAEGLEVEERAYRIAALRETWEEAGLLLANDGPAAALDDVVFDLSRLHHFAHWLTPTHLPKRFDTRFYLTSATRQHEASFDGDETVSVEWIAPLDALARAEHGDRILVPTRLNLMRLAESSTVGEAIAATSTRPFFSVMPEFVGPVEGGRLLRIPAEAGYGVTEAIQPVY